MKSTTVVDLEEKEEDEVEDWCFVCKDGGTLMLCDYKDCPKVYHAYCVEHVITKKGNEESLICPWHDCYLCSKRPTLHCLCCPHAVCEGCITHAEFIQLKENKGLCNECHAHIVSIEEIQEFAADDKVDLSDMSTFEGLLLEYWEIVKNQEDISFDDVVQASKSQKKGVKSRYKGYTKYSNNDVHSSKSRKKGSKLKYKDDPKFSLTDHKVEDGEDYKRPGKSKRMEFIRWGSKPLMDFLTSIGEDTKDAMSQHTVESIIRRYIRQENLTDPEKKKKVCCDQKLISIFRKKSVNHNKIYQLLEGHLKENVEQFEDITRLECGFGEKNEEVILPCKRQKKEVSDEKLCEKEVKPEMRSTGLATINADNIKLVYLRKSLVVELLKQNESFGKKVVGSFVKVKNDPRELIAYQILQVTGIKTADDQREGVLLYVAGMASDVSISKLEDSDISKTEIEELEQKVMNGLLRQPTVLEMKDKAKVLHEDITKHWIARQLVILQKRINYANEKGLRRELEEYLEQRELLQKPSEQERLLSQTPRITEHLVEVKSEPAASSLGSSRLGNTTGLSQDAAINID